MLKVKQLDNAKPRKEAYRIADSDRSGLCAQVTPNGAITFYLQYRHEGKRKFLNLGRYGDVSLSEAREAAKEAKAKVRQGICPKEEEQRQREAEKATQRENEEQPLVSDVVPVYLRKHVSGLESAKAVNRYFEQDVLPALGSKKVREVRRRDILDLVEDKATSTPNAARKLLTYVKGFFEWCVDREYIEHSPAASIRPKNIRAEGKKNVLKPTQRERILTDKEIKAFWQSVEACGMRRLTALALKLTLVTGQRPGEIAGMHRDEIQGNMWTIPAARRLKTETAHSVPLTDTALEIIEQAKEEILRLQARRSVQAQGYIFEAYPGKPLTVSSLSQAVSRYSDTLKNKAPAWRPHDLRRTCRTKLSEAGILDEVAEKVIGHEKVGIVRVYNQNEYMAEKRKALEAWERKLLFIGEGREAGNVVSITG